MSTNYIHNKGNVLVMTIPKAKSDECVFTKTDEIIENISSLDLFPSIIVMGNIHHKLMVIIKLLEKYNHLLHRICKLPNANLYTDHSFRTSSATLLVEIEVDILRLKRHGGGIVHHDHHDQLFNPS